MSVLPGPRGKRTWRGRKLKWEIRILSHLWLLAAPRQPFPLHCNQLNLLIVPAPWKIIPKNTNAQGPKSLLDSSQKKKKKRGEFPRAWSSFSLLNFHLWIGGTPWFSHNQLLFGSPQQQWQLKSLGWSGPLLRLHGPWARLFKRYIVTIFSCFVCDQSFVSQMFHEKTKRYQTKTKKKHTSI